MGINLGNLEQTTQPLNTQTVDASQNASTGFSLNLQKDTFLDLTKRNPGLTKVDFAAGWDVAVAGNTSFDLDISAFLLHQGTNKVMTNDDVIFFNHKDSAGIHLNKDNLTGVGEGDDETISLDLSQIPADIAKIVFAITIFGADAKQQTFGMVNNSYVRLLDVANGNQELCIYPLKEQFSTETAVIAAELIRENGEWQFHTIGEGKHADLNGLLALYR